MKWEYGSTRWDVFAKQPEGSERPWLYPLMPIALVGYIVSISLANPYRDNWRCWACVGAVLLATICLLAVVDLWRGVKRHRVVRSESVALLLIPLILTAAMAVFCY